MMHQPQISSNVTAYTPFQSLIVGQEQVKQPQELFMSDLKNRQALQLQHACSLTL